MPFQVVPRALKTMKALSRTPVLNFLMGLGGAIAWGGGGVGTKVSAALKGTYILCMSGFVVGPVIEYSYCRESASKDIVPLGR